MFRVYTILALFFLSGCATNVIVPVDPNDRVTQGLRICESKPLLLATSSGVQIILVPNHSRTYAVQFVSFLAKNETTLELDQGCIVKKADVKLDTTAVIELLKQALDKLAPNPVQATTIASKAPTDFAIYEFIFDDFGNLVSLNRVPITKYPSTRPVLK